MLGLYGRNRGWRNILTGDGKIQLLSNPSISVVIGIPIKIVLTCHGQVVGSYNLGV